MTPALIIFDCDGVLVDSEMISTSVLYDLFVQYDIPIDQPTIYERFLGRSMASMRTVLAEEYGVSMTDEHLEFVRRNMRERFMRELKPVPGVADALARLRIPLCVASSSSPERIRLSLGVTGLIDFLEPNIFSATMVKNGKPAPDLFLHAAREMGVAPARCVVIEDSPAGVMAAQAAKMSVFGFIGGGHAEPAGLGAALAALGPDLIFNDMCDLPQLLASKATKKAI
ncbi:MULTISPECIES: HAD family hydrolase [Mesorhizobium]|uniref:HAD family hydrolase n=1 Tax=Mesorhizobium denitrificans TaxID=2294114 RepID=A0A371XC06_9HYPH|nr:MULTISPECIES: HAD family hydrolase [Mesorhizobium]RFC66750.1 HAD family hydrolase [Mesorhizobium denitrificans]